MARGRLGGTKSKIRGKVGSDIYQLSRDAEGRLIQSVYAQNLNPKYTNTEAQAKNRCIMGQIDRMWHWLPNIIKDAYRAVPRGSLSFQHFARLNYTLLKDDFENHFASDNDFSWQEKFDMHAPAGSWILTDGSLPAVTWDAAFCSLGWNNGLELSWLNRPSVATYGDFLDCFGISTGDRLVLAIFRQNGLQLWGYVETWSFWPNPRFDVDSPWVDVDDQKLFLTNCPYRMYGGRVSSSHEFFFGIDTQDYPDEIKIACFALFIVRQSEHGTLFSSSQFTWAQQNVPDGYRRHTPLSVWPTWFNS